MLDAAELFHYSYKFREAVFCLVLGDEVDIDSLATDIRVLGSSHIKVVVVCGGNTQIKEKVGRWAIRGAPYSYERITVEAETVEALSNLVADRFNHHKVPVLALDGSESSRRELAFDLSDAVGAKKIFLISELPGLEIAGTLCSHVTAKEQAGVLASAELNISLQELRYLFGKQQQLGIDIVLLSGSSGSLFQEIFTHRGSGTLLTNDYPNLVRRATALDVQEISLLLRVNYEEGKILPISEEQIAVGIDNFFVYTVNNAIVATTRLTEWGDRAELAKFATLPRYQGRGRAKELALAMIAQAKKLNKTGVFALSVEPMMWRFFMRLGFSEVDRATLPVAWRESYDMTRPSRAFELVF